MDEFGEDFVQGLVEVEQAAVEEAHGHGGGGDDLGDAGDVVCGFRSDRRRGGFVGEAADCACGGAGGVKDAFTVSDFYAGAVGAVPEPGTWAMMIVGLGLVGLTLRRRGLLGVA